ncbi:hypothetical protein PAESOLCIP111_02557 [Paenibacillus solanacearum]|uniref:Spore protein YkvP/CgeB glycosyl transferase-like domain-containing protein n=1 Tax=Paenibacillus solanacearum TaxID=2048548 RepID=A0A916K1W2_9BACL|nr:glycosyltransferase [Paenibacillus solanacearum]CAG7623743.1 hypothetical protein PAESOLCIP111_02557 [Paenibacillus solanacearum]
MRIVHAPTEISGQMRTLVGGLRQAGHQVNGYNWFHTYLKYSGNIINTDAYELIKMIEPLAGYADLFHFHNSNSLLVKNADLPMLHGKGKQMVMHHWGNDVRSKNATARLNPYPIPPSYHTDERIHENLTYISQYIKHAIVQDYELYPHVADYYEHVHMLPLACMHEEIPYAYPSADNKNPMIIHAPTNREFKGSAYVEKAIDDLKRTHAFTYRAIEKMNHQQAMQMYLEADIIVDQILCGTYGMLSVEAMAMGKVVVAYVRDDVLAKFPDDLPIVVANPDTIRDVLRSLIEDPKRRRKVGKAGRAYVESFHSVDKVVPKLLGIYSKIEGRTVGG